MPRTRDKGAYPLPKGSGVRVRGLPHWLKVLLGDLLCRIKQKHKLGTLAVNPVIGRRDFHAVVEAQLLRVEVEITGNPAASTE